ncbi:hypothetical protein FGO68_gene6471 [Halteria grandinella]|uniref:PDZ GRASP-type domain-containing protein n=1 Tax=Halteria grandinella TaxID=5974 RepID=A0A8J8SX36_HALGN|nr:hypothetical protein FGO68_gene6471 [Halteria grandinella]
MGNQAQQSQYSNFAYRVLSVDTDSPASHAGLQPYLDFILYNPEANDQTLLSEFLQNSLETPLTLTIYNFINQQTRTVTLTPKLTKHDSILSARSLIGTEVRFERFDDLHERVYLVEGVQLESPAYRGGLGCGRMNKDTQNARRSARGRERRNGVNE